ncbi:MAG: hypothetical protein ACLFQV_02010 [Vulcanimicrobiota bacterium]
METKIISVNCPAPAGREPGFSTPLSAEHQPDEMNTSARIKNNTGYFPSVFIKPTNFLFI